MVDPYVGEIRVFGFNFAPRGWATCDGQLMPLSQNTALFSLLGTMYGGDGRSTFALPDMAGRAPMQWGQGPGLTGRTQGDPGGVESVTLLESEMPAHQHTVSASNRPAEQSDPTGHTLANATAQMYSSQGPNTQMHPATMGVAGGSLPHANMQPYLGMLYCIALQGVFPPRS